MTTKYFLQQHATTKEDWTDVKSTSFWLDDKNGFDTISDLIDKALAAAADGEIDGSVYYFRVIKREMELKETVL